MGGTQRLGILIGDEKELIEKSRGVTGERRVIRKWEWVMMERGLWKREPWLSGTDTRDPGSVRASPRVHSMVGLAPKASRSRMAELWPSSAEKGSVCPAEFSPSTWTTEGQRVLGLSLPLSPGNTFANSQPLQLFPDWVILGPRLHPYVFESPPSGNSASKSISTQCLSLSPQCWNKRKHLPAMPTSIYYPRGVKITQRDPGARTK